MAGQHQPGNDQERLLDEATALVKEQAFYMKRAIDNDNLREALKYASHMISELRTSLLTPKQYYDLYSNVFDEIQHAASFFADTSRHKKKMADLYETVQHAGNILPRLYLLIVVGSQYIKSKEIGAKDILQDMAELCKGVQHPMRGLFLRYFLSQMCKDKLPEPGSEYEQEDCGIEDVLDFIINNFADSAALWVRIQTQGPARDKARRERERHDLRVLVGANLVRIAQLDSLNADVYSTVALPRILQQVVASKDAMAQQYLLDCIIQVFPDEYHLLTLEQLLETCMNVTSGVDLKPVLSNLMARLETFLQENPGAVPDSLDVFELFRSHLAQLFENQICAQQSGEKKTAMDTASLLELLGTFMTFTLTMYPTRLDHVAAILKGATNLLSQMVGADSQGRQVVTGECVDAVIELLGAPLRVHSLSVLEIDAYAGLIVFLSSAARKSVAVNMVDNVLQSDIPLEDPEALTRFLQFVIPVCKDEAAPDVHSEEFLREQLEVSRLVYAIRHEDPGIVMEMYKSTRAFFGQGGPHRMVLTLPPLVYAVLKLLPVLQQHEASPTPPTTTSKKALQFVHKTITAVQACVSDLSTNAELPFRLWLHAAKATNDLEGRAVAKGGFEPICMEFLTQALICYEEEMQTDSRQQCAALQIFATSLGEMNTLDEEDYQTLVMKGVQYASKLLKKPDQIRAIAHASCGFWNEIHRDGHRVLECLQKCVRLADAVVQTNPAHVGLFVELVDRYTYFYEKGNTEISCAFIGNLLGIIKEHLEYAESCPEVTQAQGEFATMIRFLKAQKAKGQLYQDLDLSRH